MEKAVDGGGWIDVPQFHSFTPFLNPGFLSFVSIWFSLVDWRKLFSG